MIAVAGVVFLGRSSPPPAPQLETRVRTEPAGIPVRWNGEPVAGDIVRFSGDGPYGVLTAASGCRETKHRVEPADAGGEVVLVLDPARADVPVDPGVPAARVTVNGQAAGAAPTTVELDLCRDNVISVEADGYRSATATIPAKASPLEARTAAGAIKLEAIPTGRILLPAMRVPVTYSIDGRPAQRTSAGIEIPAGSHQVRATNDERFIDVTATLEVPEGGTATPELVVPAFAHLVVQTFPPNCRVALKKGGSTWRPLGETPLRHELAAGRYTLRIEAPDSGESREQEIELKPGKNAPVRVSFGRTGR